MKKVFRKVIVLTLSLAMVINLSLVSFADVPSRNIPLLGTGDEQTIEDLIIDEFRDGSIGTRSNRFYYVTERGSTQSRRSYVSNSQARDMDHIRWILASCTGVGLVPTLIMSGIFDYCIAGYMDVDTTIEKRYRVTFGSGQRVLIRTVTIMDVEIYASEGDGYILHRSFSHRLTHK